MASDETARELERIAKRIENLVDDGSCLVSFLGIALGDDLKKLKQLTNGGLKDFIESHLSHRFSLERTGIHRNIFSVVDKSASSAMPQRRESSREQNLRFHPRFWAAFSAPAKADHVRIFKLDSVSFEDLPSNEVHGSDLTIAANFIVRAGDDQRDEKIKENIASWLEQNGLSAERFQAFKRAQSPTLHQQNGSLLTAIILALDDRQLQATNLTLDVVAKLLRTPRE